MPHIVASILSILLFVALSSALDLAPKNVIQRKFSSDTASALIDYHFNTPALDLDSALKATIGDASKVKCNPADGTLTFTVSTSAPGVKLYARASTPAQVSEAVSKSLSSVWYKGMGVQLQTLGTSASCVGLRDSASDAQAFRVVQSYKVTTVADGAQVVITTAPANQTQALQRVVADISVGVNGPQTVTKRSDTTLNVLNLNWNNAAHVSGVADKSIALYSATGSSSGAVGTVDVACSTCYFWIAGTLNIHVDTGVIGEKLLTGQAEFYAYFNGSAELMAEVEVRALGTFSQTWSQTYATTPYTYTVGGVLNLNAKVGVLLEYSANLAAGSLETAVVRVGEKYSLSWGVPIDILNGKGKLAPSYTKQLSETTGYANLNVSYTGEARITPSATVGVDLLKLAGIDLTVGITGKVPHQVDAYVNAGANVITDPATGTTITLGYDCAVALVYGVAIAPFFSSSANLLGATFPIYSYTFPDIKLYNGTTNAACIRNTTTIYIPASTTTASLPQATTA